MEIHQLEWNLFYANNNDEHKDDWLIKYEEYFKNSKCILDLGCGNGSNIPFLMQCSSDVTAIDYSHEAINYVKEKWNIKSLVMDMRKPFPFNDNEFEIVLADLSLHYFTEKQTYKIINEIFRITMNKGFLFCRLNSINDDEVKMYKSTAIERNYYNRKGIKKRYFDKEMIYDFFNYNFVVIEIEEKKTMKYQKEKVLWEIVCSKIA